MSPGYTTPRDSSGEPLPAIPFKDNIKHTKEKPSPHKTYVSENSVGGELNFLEARWWIFVEPAHS